VGSDICIAIAGNKIDLEKDRHVDKKEALSYAESVGAAHYNTSAKINKGLEEVFGDLSKKMLQRRSEKASGATTMKGKQRLVIIEDTPPTVSKKSSGCC